jgi:hypothetical protein
MSKLFLADSSARLINTLSRGFSDALPCLRRTRILPLVDSATQKDSSRRSWPPPDCMPSAVGVHFTELCQRMARKKLGPSGILVGRSSAFSYSASRYSYSYSKTPESIQVDHLFREAATPLFGPFVNKIPILLFEYEYRFTEYEYEKNHW